MAFPAGKHMFKDCYSNTILSNLTVFFVRIVRFTLHYTLCIKYYERHGDKIKTFQW